MNYKQLIYLNVPPLDDTIMKIHNISFLIYLMLYLLHS